MLLVSHAEEETVKIHNPVKHKKDVSNEIRVLTDIKMLIFLERT